MPYRAGILVATVLLSLGAPAAHAAVTISSSPTQNMTCSGGTCSPTASQANLNVTDLEAALAAGNTTVTTTGAGVQATDIDVDAALTWATSGVLSLNARRSIRIDKPVAVNGLSGLTIVTNNGGSGGTFSFGPKGNVTFLDLASGLTINGTAFTLENSIASLASAISANPAGSYALANSYDASKDGTYARSPISTEFSGVFEGLGNTISKVTINDPNSGDYVGLISEVGSDGQPGGMIENIVLTKLNISSDGLAVGGLVGLSVGSVNGSFVSGTVTSNLQQGAEVGLLIGANFGTIARSGSAGAVENSPPETGGGLVGGNHNGSITQSYADCDVSGGTSSGIGGLAGGNLGAISDSYAMGTVKSGEDESDVGGLVGGNSEESTIVQAYSTTTVKPVKGYPPSNRGGLIGRDYSPPGSNTSTYWDMQTSGIDKPSKGAGDPQNDPGITGETTAQLQSGLPAGFDPTIWAESPSINNGFPYLINNPPR